ncbi:hypothetical protein OIE75_09440 [Streptomyces sp. NBC_01723]|uniref:hypothetical protein n=1 Tax=Streptomyces sp. NBC_01723 TaxID=2975921 RepID=UPI002E2EE17C|nr:hypothetical protein [Streptomyces sp. NBC_01723]
MGPPPSIRNPHGTHAPRPPRDLPPHAPPPSGPTAPPALARARVLRSPLGVVSRARRAAAAARGGRPPWGGLDAVASRAVVAAGEILPARGGAAALRALETVPAEGAAGPARATRASARAVALATRAPARRPRLTAAPPTLHARPAEPPALRTPVENFPKGPAPR